MSSNIYIEVNHRVLVWARESMAISRAQASERSGISSKRLAQLEDGDQKPSLDELKIFSKLYKRTIATLLLSAPPKEKPLPKDQRTINSKSIGEFHEKTIMAVRKARALAQSLVELKRESGVSIPQINFSASISDNPQLIATKIRSSLGIDEIRNIKNINLALEAYIEKVESLGVAVFQLSLTQDHVRGFSIVDDVIPIIGIKGGGEPPHAKTFTLFHELGHILLNEGGICDLADTAKIDVEKWCNAFAAEVLIPASEFLGLEIISIKKRQHESNWAKKELIEIANYFHVGPLAILRSLLENNLTTSTFYKEKHEAWNKPQFGRSKTPEGRNIAKEAIREKGKTYVSLAFSAFDKNKIDLKDLSDFLGVRLAYISKTRQLLSA